MKRILDYRKLFNITTDTTLAELKVIYRNLMKQWHPDKFKEGDELYEEAQHKSKEIIEAYHFLVSISPETHAAAEADYLDTITNSGIQDFNFKGQLLTITFQNGSVYEYFGVTKNIFNKLVNSDIQSRFARRHIYQSFIYRNVFKNTVPA
jgi:DnaJ-class molecular chaperone